uniref:Uncharacterized protein n=1 Tax=Bionectria ochroleuca TaxID=29856 RepID=A0A8H7NAA7_BIOOC
MPARLRARGHSRQRPLYHYIYNVPRQSWNPNDLKCHCPANQIVVDGNCQLLGCGTAAYAKDGRCEVDCGPDATLKNWKCVCKVKGRTWNANTLKCTCSSRRKATKTR